MKLIQTIDFTKDEFYQVSFTEMSDLFIVTKNRTSNEWKYYIKEKIFSFLPCNGQEYNFGALDKNGEQMAIRCRNFSAEIWDLKMAKRLVHIQLTIPIEKSQESSLIDLSPNAKRLIYKPSILSEEARLRDATNGAEIATLTSDSVDCETCNRTVYRTEFSPDSKFVAVSFGGIILVWNTQNGDFQSVLKDEKVHLRSSESLSHNGAVSQILFSKDSRTVITGSYDGVVKSWEVETGKLLQTFKGHKDRITSLGVSPEGKTLATGSRDKRFKLWDLETGKLLLTSANNKNWVHLLSFSPDGKKILSLTDNQVFIWETSTGQLLEQMKSPGELSTRFSPDWRFVITPDKKEKTLGLYEYIQ